MIHLDRDTIDAAKEKLRIPSLWRMLGLPGEPRPSGKSPFREDKHPSFSIFADGRQAKDHGTGEVFDGPAFLAKARGLGTGDSLREFVRLAGGEIPQSVRDESSQYEHPTRPDLSKLRDPLESELKEIAGDRNLDLAATQRASELGTLKSGRVCGFFSWVVTDPSGLTAEGRRRGRHPYPSYGSLPERKAHTIKGSSKRWPVGLGVDAPLIERAAMVVVTEGGPDYVASWHFIVRAGRTDILPISVLGRGIHGLLPEAIALMADKRVKFFPHLDADGGAFEGMKLIAAQLSKAGCDCSYFDFSGLRQTDGSPVTDLNDLTSLDPSQGDEISQLYA